MKTSVLQGAALDWAVAKCEDKQGKGLDWVPPNYSTDWSQGGPIVERERIALCPGYLWEASKDFDAIGGDTDTAVEHGLTPLIAAMRCYVTSKLGDEVEIPEELK
jgi:Protein of unknown function (DUF2591)